MRRKAPLLTFAISILITSCGAVTQVPPTTTITLTSTILHPVASTPTWVPTYVPSRTPAPSDEDENIEWDLIPRQGGWPFEFLEGVPSVTVVPCTTDVTANEAIQEFMGLYRFWSGLGGASLVINCDGTFVAKVETDSATVDAPVSGEITFQDGEFVLIYKGMQGMITRLIPVRWGPRKYLIDREEFEEFCEAMEKSSGLREPRGQGDYGRFYLREGDDALEATGDPILPSGEKLCP